MKKSAKTANIVRIGHAKISLEDVASVAFGRAKVSLHPKAKGKIRAAREFLARKTARGETLYGVNTGFGPLSDVRVADADLEKLQYNLLRSHAVGVGAPIDVAEARAMMLLRAHQLALGHSGVRLEVIEQIVRLLEAGVTPFIPEQGSVGASGDLAPLAHLALVLIGEGSAFYRGKLLDGGKALQAAKIAPIRLGPKEGLALINGTQFMAAIGTLALLESEYLRDLADLTGAMTLEATKGTTAAFDPGIHALRPHPGQIEVARRLRRFLEPDGKPTAIARSHADCGKVQDPYSLRCMPQVHGASRDALRFVRETFEREINSVTDNPLVFPAARKVLSGGNFHGQYLALALDFLSIAMAEYASIAERRIELLVNPVFSGLPAFLVEESGLNSGFMIVQYAAASVVSENKTLAHPASVDSIPTSNGKEDHVSMGAWAARKAKRIVENTRRVLAMEYLVAAQGIDFHRPLRSSKPIERAMATLRKIVPKLDADRALHPDMESANRLVRDRRVDCALD